MAAICRGSSEVIAINSYEIWFDNDFDDEEFDLDECGYSPEFGCLLAATEFCDWECPIRRVMMKED